MPKTNNVASILAQLKELTSDELNALGLGAKAQGTQITSRKVAEARMVVAKRINLRDSSPTAKRIRYEGTIEYLTAKQLENTLKVWVKKTKAETPDEHIARVNAEIDKIMSGAGTFKNAILEIVGLGGEVPLTDDLPVRVELAK